jgi:hypothetical protein
MWARVSGGKNSMHNAPGIQIKEWHNILEVNHFDTENYVEKN